MIVDEADAPVDYGGTTAAPFAGQILADVLPYLGCTSNQQRVETEVPDVVGLSLGEAGQRMSTAGFRVLTAGGGQQVTAQMPSPGARLVEGGQVMLYTDPQEALTAEQLVCVPDTQGLSIAQAGALLRQRGLEMEISGTGLATRQEPAQGEFVPQGTVIRVTFDLPSP